MSIVFNIMEDTNGLWRICRGDVSVLDDLPFASAIRHARQLARDLHAATRTPTKVVLSSPEFEVILAQHARPADLPEPRLPDSESVAA